MNFLRFSSLLAWIFVWTAVASVRAAYDVEVTGSTSGSVWGSGPYTNDSSLGAAAVHSGILQPGQTGIVRVHALSGQSSYAGSTANGVTTMSWGAWGGSISLQLLGLAGGGGGSGANQLPLAWLSQAAASARTGEVLTVKGKARDPEDRLHWLTIRWLNHGVQGSWSLGGTTGEQERTTTLTAPASPDTMYVRAESSDQDGAATAGIWHAITVAVPPNSPTVYASVPDWMLVGETRSIAVSALDDDGDIDTVYIEQQGVSAFPLHRSVSGGDVFQVGSFTAPSSPQTIYLRAGAIDSGGHTVVTAWRAVPVLATPPASIAVSPGSLSLGALLTVSYGNAPAGAHLRLHAMGAADSSYISSTTVSAAGNGSVPMPIGSGFTAGQSYQARLFAANGTALLASSTAFAVTATPSADFYEADVVGASSGGSVWGTDVYTDDSHLGMIAAHTGLLVNGQAGRLRVFRLAGLSSYAGSTRHGVTTLSSSAYPRSIRVELIATGAIAYDPQVQIHLPAAPAQVTAGETFLAHAEASDANGDLQRAVLTWGGTPLIDRTYTASYTDGLSIYADAGLALGGRLLRVWAGDGRNPAGTPGSPGYGVAETTVNVIGANAAPQIASMSATVNSLNPAEVTLQARATDTDNNLRAVNFYIAEPPAYNGMFLVGSADVAGGDATASFVWRPAQLAPGTVYRLLAVSRDAAGVSSTNTTYEQFSVPATAYTLTVENGIGGGSEILAGSMRTITANPPVTGQSFVNWTLVSGSGTFANATLATTTFTMGSGNAVVRANYTIAPSDYVIDTSRNNFNLAAALGNPGFARTYNVTINAGVIVGSANSNSPAFTTGTLPLGSSVVITNNGRIQGAGGAGGKGSDGYNSPENGTAGGDALFLSVATTISNGQGEVWGGGGGGGGSGSYFNNSGSTSGSGGGGGSGTAPGVGGSKRFDVTYHYTGEPGAPGSAGSGGLGGSSSWDHLGGSGGAPGEPGGGGSEGSADYLDEYSSNTGGGYGGAAGRAVTANGFRLIWQTGMNYPNVRGSVVGASIDTTPPSVPVGLVAAETSSGFALTWTAASDNSGVAGYEVMRDAASLGFTAATGFHVVGSTAQSVYSFKIRARDLAGNWSLWSSTVTVTAQQTSIPVDFVLPAARSNFNLAQALGNPSVPKAFTIVVEAGVMVGSTSTSSPAFTTGALPAGSSVRIINSGHIQGAGGAGGVAGDGDGGGEPGGPGGDALQLTVPTSIDNTFGEIWGGGGGGGGSGGFYNENVNATGSGGGGGSGTIAGSGGAESPNPAVIRDVGEPGAAGTASAGGTGGRSNIGQNGGDGGAPGNAGNNGSHGSTLYLEGESGNTSGGAGGAAGHAVRLNGHALTWLGGMNSPRVRGTSGGTSAIAPVITTHPTSQTKLVGQTVSLTVAATGSAPLVFQWRKNGTDIAGATAATLTLANLHLTDAGSYTARVVNGAGSVTSNAATIAVVPFDDSDADGVPNAIEVLLGTNPSTPGQNDSGNATQLIIQRPQP